MDEKEYTSLLEEYKICISEAIRLEDQIWKVSTHLGIFSGAGILLKLVSALANKDTFYITVAIAIIMITFSLVWWRLSRRWWSIQHIKFNRMDEIESKIGFSQNAALKDIDKAKMSHIKYLQNKLQRFDDHLFYSIPEYIPPKKFEEDEKISGHECRGNQPVIKLLVISNILIWVGLVFMAAKSSHIHLLATFIIFVLYLILTISLWRKA